MMMRIMNSISQMNKAIASLLMETEWNGYNNNGEENPPPLNKKTMTFEQTEERLLKLMMDMNASQGGMQYPILVDEDGQEFYVRDLVITEDRELIYEFRYMMDSESDWQLVIVPEEDIAAAITELEECFYE